MGGVLHFLNSITGGLSSIVWLKIIWLFRSAKSEGGLRLRSNNRSPVLSGCRNISRKEQCFVWWVHQKISFHGWFKLTALEITPLRPTCCHRIPLSSRTQFIGSLRNHTYKKERREESELNANVGHQKAKTKQGFSQQKKQLIHGCFWFLG